MLAAILLNLPDAPFVPGGIYGVDEEKADRALKQLRKEYFEEQERLDALMKKTDGAPEIAPEEVVKIKAFEGPAVTAVVGEPLEEDEALALLLILAES